jgi:hypothetical protein
MSSYLEPPTNLQALLRNACHRALGRGLSFTNQIRLYRSIVALAREVRLRIGGRQRDAGNDTLPALLASVCEHASAVGADPELPLPDAMRVQRLAVQLSRAARMASGADPRVRDFLGQHPIHREKAPRPEAALDVPPSDGGFIAQNPMHRENPPPREDAGAHERIEAPQDPIHREKASRPEAALDVPPSDGGFIAQNPMHRENPPPRENAGAHERIEARQDPIHREKASRRMPTPNHDDSQSARRNDRNARHGQRVCERLSEVFDERKAA